MLYGLPQQLGSGGAAPCVAINPSTFTSRRICHLVHYIYALKLVECYSSVQLVDF